MGGVRTPRGRAKRNLLGFGRRGVFGYQRMLEESGVGPQRSSRPSPKPSRVVAKPPKTKRSTPRAAPVLLPAQRAAEAGLSEASIRRAYESGAANLTEAIEMAERRGWRNPKHHPRGVAGFGLKLFSKAKQGARTALGLYERAYDTAVTRPLHEALRNPYSAHGLVSRPTAEQVRVLISQAETSRSVEELRRLWQYGDRMQLPDLKSAAAERARRMGLRGVATNPGPAPADRLAQELAEEQARLIEHRAWLKSEGYPDDGVAQRMVANIDFWEKALAAAGRRRRNPEAEADRMYESFHGRPADQTIEVEEEFHEHDHLATLGVFVNLICHTLSGYEVVIGLSEAESAKQDFDEESADPDTIFLASNEEGTQLYLVGGDQEVDLDRIHMGGKWKHDDMILGELVELTYRTRKKFDKFKLTDYYHEVGEDSGERAMLRYEPRSKHLYVSGGKYQIKMPLVGMSAGIED